MKLYQLKGHVVDLQPMYYGTFTEAKTSGKQMPSAMIDMTIVELDVPTDKAGIVAIMNGNEMTIKESRYWEFTKRGGTYEVDMEGNRIGKDDQP